MRRIISKKFREPTLKDLQQKLVEAVTNLAESFKDDKSYESTATAEAEVRAIEAEILEWHQKNPRESPNK